MPIFNVKKTCHKCDGCGKLVTGLIHNWAKYGLVKSIPEESIITCDGCDGSGIIYMPEFICEDYINKRLEKGKSMNYIISKIEHDG